MEFQPPVSITLSKSSSPSNLKTARRGAAPGPSGCTAEHLKVLLDDEGTLELFTYAAERLAQARVPGCVVDGLRLGRMVALRKSNGKVRGIVAGDVFRRMVGRTIAQQLAPVFTQACSPFQYALSTRAGTECVAHAIRAVTERHPTATIVSIDGVGAFDHVSRQAILGNFMRLPRGAAALPFARVFYGLRSVYLWHDQRGHPHDITEAEGEAGESDDFWTVRAGATLRHSAGPV